MLACHIKTVKNGYPFKIEATKVEEIEADFDPDFLRHIFPPHRVQRTEGRCRRHWVRAASAKRQVYVLVVVQQAVTVCYLCCAARLE